MRKAGCLLLMTFWLWASGSVSYAQTDISVERARQAYAWFVAGQGDSLRTMMNDEMKRALPAAAISDMLKGLEKQFGKLRGHGDWTKLEAEGFIVCHTDMEFERFRLRFQVTFDGGGLLAGLFVKPVPDAPSPAATLDAEKGEEREVTVQTGRFRLPGTLTLPRQAADGECRVPCVVMVHGSGPNDRDETVGPNKPFRDLAWWLAERGIASVRYDKRTRVYGLDYLPEGRRADYDTETVDDAVSAVALVRKLPQVCADSVFVLGHSLGGMLAPRIASRSEGLCGVIILAGLARPFEDALAGQVEYLNSLVPSEEGRRQVEELKAQVANVKRLGTDAFCDTIGLPLGLPRSYWECVLRYKPVEEAAALSLPLLVLQGERDYQVTMQDFGLWRMGLLRCRNASFKSYPKLNHLLQEGTGMSTPFEYQQALPVPAYVADDLVRFIRSGRL